ncbi:MAG TPA: antibiotic biosynthesis monooxygenase family protein, partial [Tepidisphaeraceae bacterium]|nr:antibiotic biosynthesis monooxygenase family protein [Tepidisphaeraceae bacterium]
LEPALPLQTQCLETTPLPPILQRAFRGFHAYLMPISKIKLHCATISRVVGCYVGCGSRVESTASRQNKPFTSASTFIVDHSSFLPPVPSLRIRPMTTIGMHYDVIAGKEAEFENGFTSVLAFLKTVAGHVESHLYEDVHSTGSYLIFSEWETHEAFQTFLQSPEFRNVVVWGKAEILRGRPRHKVYKNA